MDPTPLLAAAALLLAGAALGFVAGVRLASRLWLAAMVGVLTDRDVARVLEALNAALAPAQRR